MSNYETIYLMEHSIEQIEALRRTVADLEPKAHAYDTISQILALRTDNRAQGFGVDLVWELRQKVARLREADKDVDAHIGDVLADAQRPEKPWWDVECTCEPGPCHHDPLDLREARRAKAAAQAGANPRDGSDGDE